VQGCMFHIEGRIKLRTRNCARCGMEEDTQPAQPPPMVQPRGRRGRAAQPGAAWPTGGRLSSYC
jgi:hypothetical protein